MTKSVKLLLPGNEMDINLVPNRHYSTILSELALTTFGSKAKKMRIGRMVMVMVMAMMILLLENPFPIQYLPFSIVVLLFMDAF